MTCTIPEQVFEVLTEEASQWGVRAAIFDVRGKAAWGASAHGFGPALSEKVLRSLIVQLNQDNPFRQVCETAGHVDASAETLKKNRNVLDKLKPAPHAPILLLPIRSAGTVTAIFYADPGEKGDPLPVNALKILAEFAGAQIDRLIALSGGFSDEEVRGRSCGDRQSTEAPAEEATVEVLRDHAGTRACRSLTPRNQRWKPRRAVVAEACRCEVHTEAEVVEPPAPEPEPPARRPWKWPWNRLDARLPPEWSEELNPAPPVRRKLPGGECRCSAHAPSRGRSASTRWRLSAPPPPPPCSGRLRCLAAQRSRAEGA